MPPRDDGLLIAFKKSKFDLVRKFEMEFFISESDPLMCKQNVALFCVLRQKSSNRLILTVNCHILFNKSRGDIKFAQILLIIRAIRQIMALYGIIK